MVFCQSVVGHRMNEVLQSPNIAMPVMDKSMFDQMQQSADQASQLLKSLSHPDRLMLLCQLTQGEYCVSELEEQVGLGQPSLSQQLGILRKDGLVMTRREGKQIYYSIVSDDALAVLQVLYSRFCQR
jgi:DNA-binding transcriptional ArsR family regulator